MIERGRTRRSGGYGNPPYSNLKMGLRTGSSLPRQERDSETATTDTTLSLFLSVSLRASSVRLCVPDLGGPHAPIDPHPQIRIRGPR